MTPVEFPEANTKFGPPSDLEESQCQTISAYVSQVKSGSCNGAVQVVVAWKPTEDEIRQIVLGAPIFPTCLGGLPPHFLTTNFSQATTPA
jgi:hypothetical protein